MIEPFTELTAIAVPLLRDNVDTDAIVPSREMRTVSKSGLSDGLFAGWRYVGVGSREPDPTFVLNDPAYAGAQILIAGANFGCGSSREHAVWALKEYGFRAIVAPSFNPIFYSNCVANGVAPVTLDSARIAEIAGELAASPDHRLTVDLVDQHVSSPRGAVWPFEIDSDSRHALLHGLDPIGQTLQLASQIEAFRLADARKRPWIYSSIARGR